MYWDNFPAITPLRFELESSEDLRMPEYKGALFRGGFGHFFRNLVCVTRQPVCQGCPQLTNCPYSIVFESPLLHPDPQMLRRCSPAPHPFVMVPPLSDQRVVAKGQRLQLLVTLFGDARRYLPHFISVLEELGRSGCYGGCFRLLRVHSEAGHRPVIYEGAFHRIVSEEIPTLSPTFQEASRVRLHFLTPLRLRVEGAYHSSPGFSLIIQALLRRLHFLSLLYGQAPETTEWTKPLLAAGDLCVTESRQFKIFHWSRMSGRQMRRLAMDGILGCLEVSGVLSALMPVLQLGQWVNVGSGTSMGLGKYALEVVC